MSVPVLSKAIAFNSESFSKWIPPLIRIPFFAEFERAAREAGVADATSAQGEATTNNTIPR